MSFLIYEGISYTTVDTKHTYKLFGWILFSVYLLNNYTRH